MSDLPPLPPDDILDEDECSGCVYGYTERQMIDYARAAIASRDKEITRLRSLLAECLKSTNLRNHPELRGLKDEVRAALKEKE